MRWVGYAAAAAAVAVTVTGCGLFNSSSTASSQNPGAGYMSSPSASSAGSMQAQNASSMTLRTEPTAAGTVLATGNGLSLYYYTGDRPHSGKSSCTGSCASAWPALAAPVQVPAGVRLGGPVGSITRANGVRQVTIDGYPIYRYIGDKSPGQVTGNGVGGEWHVVPAHGSAAATATAAGGLMEVKTTAAGSVLANPHGMTVYYFTGDKPGSGVSACTGHCATVWPPVMAPVRIPAGVKLAGPVGSIACPMGGRQVTVDGYPIYRYAGDHAPGQAAGNGIGGKWHVIRVTKPSSSSSGY